MTDRKLAEAAEALKSPVGSMSEGLSEEGGSMSEAGHYKKEPKNVRAHAHVVCAHA